jgi:hypothetical protein
MRERDGAKMVLGGVKENLPALGSLCGVLLNTCDENGFEKELQKRNENPLLGRKITMMAYKHLAQAESH